MDKVVAFIEKLATPLVITAIIGLVAMYVQVSIIDYQVSELQSWKSSGERCTKEDCALMELRISNLEREVYMLEKHLKNNATSIAKNEHQEK